MILVDHQITDLAENHGLMESFDPSCVTNIGYDLRAKRFYVSGKGAESVTLQPGDSAFVESVEVVTIPENMAAFVSLKNSRIRQGLSLEAPIYQPGHKTRIYFRLRNVSADAITLCYGDKYGTLVLQQLAAVPDQKYTGAFKDEFDFRGLGDYQDIYRRQNQQLEQQKNDIKEMERGIYGNVLVILTVFVALFSFLTTNISLAASAATMKDYFTFNALLLGCISFLAALIVNIVKPGKSSLFYWIPSVICFAVSFFLFLR